MTASLASCFWSARRESVAFAVSAWGPVPQHGVQLRTCRTHIGTWKPAPFEGSDLTLISCERPCRSRTCREEGRFLSNGVQFRTFRYGSGRCIRCVVHKLLDGDRDGGKSVPISKNLPPDPTFRLRNQPYSDLDAYLLSLSSNL